MSAYVFMCLILGFILRIWLSETHMAEWIADRNEVVTPLTSWDRVIEGLALMKRGISPYTGDILHETPLMLRIFNWMNNKWENVMYIAFSLLDTITAYVLVQVAHELAWHLILKQKKHQSKYTEGMKEKLGYTLPVLQSKTFWVAIFYLFNPYSIATCLAKSTAVFNNLFIALAMLYTLKGYRNGSTLFIALAAYQSLYPVMLLVPAAMYFAQDEQPKDFKHTNWKSLKSYGTTTLYFIFWTAGLLYYSNWVEKLSWDFLYSTYGFILTVPDLTPNIGVFWYFFTEMFEHFRLFFICVFQINAFIYTVPLAIKFRDHPIFLMYILVALMAIFKSYPSYADTALYLSLLPSWYFINDYMRNPLVVGCMFICSTVLAPVLWHLWIYAGSANANFYFAITLVYSTAQIFLVTDILFAFLRREYDLFHGSKPTINGKPAEVVME